MILAVGGHTRNIGKTSLVCSLIAAFPEARWTAVKITQYGHGVCSAQGEDCKCADIPNCPYALDEETKPSGSDTGRFLASGAARAVWLRTAQGQLAEGLPAFRELVSESEHVIAETNSLIGYMRPALYLAVLDYSVMDFKDSARRFLDRASAFAVVRSDCERPRWPGISRRQIESKPGFSVTPPDYCSPELIEFVRPYVASGSQASNVAPVSSFE
jgi:hypothetical protein